MTRKLSLVLLFTLCALLFSAGWAAARWAPSRLLALPGTAFTYQGLLRDQGQPADGAYDLQFALYDALAEGAQVGETLAMDDVPVSGGLFSVSLDFGAVFDLRELFLEVSVRLGATDGAFTTLAPRQALTPAPYSLYAPQAGQAETAVTADSAAFASQAAQAQTADSAPWGGLTEMPAGFADGIDDDTLYTPGAGLVLSATQFSLDPAYVDGRYWNVDGNGGLAAGNFLGTTDAVSLTLAVNGAPALRLAPGTASPNLLGGYAANQAASGVSGATIGGGGNAAQPNQTGANYATVGGGSGNAANALGATVGGGSGNSAAGDYAIVAGGTGNTVDGANAAIGGGTNNTATGESVVVAGGYNNQAVGAASTVGGGGANNALGLGATVAGGAANVAGGVGATVGGGSANLATGIGAVIPGGVGASASHYGELAYSSGFFVTPGDAQTSVYVLRNGSFGSATAELFLDGLLASQRLTLASGRSLVFESQVVGRGNAGNSAGYRITGLIENVNGTTAFVGAPLVEVLGEDVTGWDVTVSADDANDALVFQANGSGFEIIVWVATVRTTEVALP